MYLLLRKCICNLCSRNHVGTLHSYYSNAAPSVSQQNYIPADTGKLLQWVERLAARVDIATTYGAL